MKTIFYYCFLAISAFALSACSSDDDSGTTQGPQLVLTASATETTTGEEITFEVTADGEAVSNAEILIDGVATGTGYSHVFETAGNYQVIAQKEGFQDSEAVEVHVEEEKIRLKTYTKNGLVTTFSYNADNYLSSYNYGGIDVSNVIYDAENRVIQNGSLEYTYNNLGQITKMTEQDAGPSTNKQATFIYNNEGLVARSYNQLTFNTTTYHFTRDFEYDTDGRLVSLTEKESGQSTKRFLLTYDGNGNISQIKQQSSFDGSPFTDVWTKSYTYDDKKNPGYMLLNSMGITDHTSLFFTLEMEGVHFFGDYVFFMMVYHSPNNVLSYSYSGSSGSFNNTYEYVYNEDDYPTSVEETRNLPDGSTDMRYYSWEYETFVVEE